jgi:formylglycine-generating enzyme required for sulfatase activity
MTDTKRPLKVFLCHAHADRDTVRSLYTRLTQDGVDAWLDKEKLLPGQDWELEIRKAVREADVVVVCLSKKFNQAGFRQKEVRLALDTAMEQPEGEIFVIPARLEECDVPPSLQRYHWVDLFDENGYEMLLRAFKNRVDSVEIALKAGNDAVHEFRKPEIKKGETPRRVTLGMAAALAGFAVIVVAALFIPSFLGKWFAPISESTVTPTMTGEMTLLAVSSPTSTVILEPTIRPSPTTLPLEITDAKNVPMVLVPVGEFNMGSADGPEFDRPVNIFYLNSFYIDKYEVSNSFYKACVDANVCTPPKQSKSATRESYYGNPEFGDHPVIAVNWYQVDEYCKWRGGSLPSEAQWEKAARGGNDFIYPWGNTFNPALLNFCDKNCPMGWAMEEFDDGYEDTSPVDMFEGGQSPYGAFNMSGNVYEWTLDWYDAYPGGNASADEGFGETSKVVRGGSWFDSDYMLRADHRFKLMPDDFEDIVGFRCVWEVP